MPLQLDSRAIKAEARSLLHTGEVNPFKLTLFYLRYLPRARYGQCRRKLCHRVGRWLHGAFVQLCEHSRSGLSRIVLNAGYFCYCLRHPAAASKCRMIACSTPSPSPAKVILLSIVEGIFIFLWSMLFVIPGIVAAYRYSLCHAEPVRKPGSWRDGGT